MSYQWLHQEIYGEIASHFVAKEDTRQPPEPDEALERRIDDALETQARDEMTKHEPYYRDWAVEHTEDFVPAIRAALAGDHQLAATILRELFGDYTDVVLDDQERRREVADHLE